MFDFLQENLTEFNNSVLYQTDEEILNEIAIEDKNKIIACLIMALSIGFICVCISGVCRRRDDIIIRNERELLRHYINNIDYT